MSKLRVTYEVEDGYAGKSRPQTVSIDRSEIRDCANADEAMKLVEASCQDHFEENIRWAFTDADEIRSDIDDMLKGNS